MARFKDTLLLWLSGIAGSWIIRLYSMTFRISVSGVHHLSPLLKKNGNVIYAFWHSRMLLLVYRHSKQNIQILISRHRDGEIASRIIERLGYSTVRGSSSSGGGAALLKMNRELEQGRNYAFTPDGPRGPKEKVKPGVIHFARSSGLPVIPGAASAEKKFVLKSWDGYIIPWPFTRVRIAYGEPLFVPKEAGPEEIERYTEILEKRITQLTHDLDEAAVADNDT